MDGNSELRIRPSFLKKEPGKKKNGLFLSWTHFGASRYAVTERLPLTLVSGIPLLLAGLIPIHLLPSIPCAFLKLTSYPCPFCGFTRSFWSAARGDWAFAIYNSPLACLIYFAAVLVFAWNLSGLVVGLSFRRGLKLRIKILESPWIIHAVTTLAMMNWAYRLILGLE
ncbi:MAG: DUF2752 domain-containing protein [Deltaproteobacteria bacterium]|nr:DUF2752 domain-containing protein [Deltaproteobacteria bacterium]MBW2053220.1 DUF2752 domain-containing protein [Deltaproteobacteria bacterium]MBW2140123.1 DUF2752 domain-containing protein [Deltaproteobacteria bacterium]MBW2323506.1 DUF2752 domain-containing protein [Deltaproteobacteria bacterium]